MGIKILINLCQTSIIPWNFKGCNDEQMLRPFFGFTEKKGRGCESERIFVYMSCFFSVSFILHRIDIRTILPNFEGSCMVYISKWYIF